MDDAEDPASLLVSGRDKGHAQAGDGPEGDDGDCRTNAIGRDLHMDLVSADRETKDAGDDDGESDAPVKNEIDAIALHTQQGLADEVKDCAAHRRAKQRGMKDRMQRARHKATRVVRARPEH